MDFSVHSSLGSGPEDAVLEYATQRPLSQRTEYP
jgi:hypothetical protein